MENSKILEILVGFLLSLLSGSMIWVLNKVTKLQTDMQAIKTNYVSQFGDVKLKIEEAKNLFIQENQTTRHTLRNEMQKVNAELYQNFVTKDFCEKEHRGH